MKNTPAAKVRNFAIAGHASAGKTALADLLLFASGKVARLGKTSERNSVSDYHADEQEKQYSIYSTPLHCSWQGHELFFLDTPGNPDFFGETVGALSVADAALLVVDALAGPGFGTVRAYRLAKEHATPRFFFINGLDKPNASFDKTLAAIQQDFGATACVPLYVPVGEGGALSGVVSVLDPQGPHAALADGYHNKLLDAIAEADEELMTRYLDGATFTDAEIAAGMLKAILAGTLMPIFCGSVAKNVGIKELLDGIVHYFPDPLRHASLPLAAGELALRADGPGLAFVYKSVLDPFIGHLTFARVFSGTITTDHEIHNVTHNLKERVGGMLLLNGKEQETVHEAGPGELVAIAKLKGTKTNDTLASGPTEQRFHPIVFPKPNMSFAVFAAKRGEEDKIATGLHRLAEEDPTIRVERNNETHELLLFGLGDQHLMVSINRLKTNAHIELELKTPKVPYRETVTAIGNATHRHKKQSGGHGQFAEVHLRVEPLHDKDYEFANEVVGGNIPKNFIPAVEKGVVDAMNRGPLARCKVTNVKAVVTDGKYHPVDSSDMAFQIASRSAFREAMQGAKAILLEPIMKLKINAPEEYAGDISGDLNHRRGRILGMGIDNGLEVIEAEMPLAESFTYASQLRSLTQGRGSYDIEFARYEAVPPQVAKHIMEEAAKEAGHHEEE